MKSEIATLRKSVSENRATNEELQSCVKELNGRVNYQEDCNRGNDIRISGIAEQQHRETWKVTAVQVSTLLQDKLQVPPTKIERAHRVGSLGNPKPKTMVARFENIGNREKGMRNARKLKGTGM